MSRAAAASLSVLLLVTCAATAAGQEIERELGTDLADYGGFVGLDVHYGQIFDEYGLIMGAHIAVMLGQRFYAGVTGNALISNPNIDAAITLPTPSLDMHYGGVLLGWVVPFRSPVQFALETMLGAGRAKASIDVGDSNEASDWDGIVLVEPRFVIDVQFAETLRLGLSAGYRYVSSVEVPNVTDDDLRGLVGTASFRLAWF